MKSQLGLTQIVFLSALKDESQVPVRKIREHHYLVFGKKITSGALYTSLNRLVAAGLVRMHHGDTHSHDARHIATYSLTNEGNVKLVESLEIAQKVLNHLKFL